MTITLSIGNRDFRLVGQRADQSLQYLTINVPAGIIKDGLIIDIPAAAALIRECFQKHALHSKEISVCLTGLSFIYRILTLPVIRGIKQKSVIERATQKEINLPLDELYLAWQIISRSETELKVFVLGFARPLVDAIYATLKQAGLNLKTLELKALALTRASGHADALIIDCEPDAFEVLIIHSGIPVTIHRISPKNEMSTLSDNLNQLIIELNRAIDYYNLTNPEHPLTQKTPVLLSGALCDDIPSRDLIIASLEHNPEFLKPRLPVTADFPVSTFAANLGLLYKKDPSTGWALNHLKKQPDQEINLLNARHRALKKPVQVKQLLAVAAITGAIILFIPVWILRLQAINETTSLKQKADNLFLELSSLNRELVENSQIQNKIESFSSQTEALFNERIELTGRGDIAANLLTLTQQLPAGANISNISAKPANITLEGSAENSEEVISYIYNLEKQNLFSEVRIALLDKHPERESEVIFRLTIER